MCPMCVASMALIAAGATSGGGVTVFTVSKLYRKEQTKPTGGKQNETERDGIRNKSGTKKNCVGC